MTVDDDSLICELRDEADICRNEGVEELALLLDSAATRIERLICETESLAGEIQSLAMDLAR